jgi:hypothetical protein
MLHYTLNMTITIFTCISYLTRFYHVSVMEQLVDASSGHQASGVRKEHAARRGQQQIDSRHNGVPDTA